MKLNIKNTALLALASLALLPTASQAAGTISGNPSGDLYMGFRLFTAGSGLASSAGTQDYIVNLGAFSEYSGVTTGSTVNVNTSSTVGNIGNIASDLVSVFGASWYSRTDLAWGIIGASGNPSLTSDPINTLYASKPQPTNGTNASAILRNSNSNQATPDTKIETFIDNLYNIGNNTYTASTQANSVVGIIESLPQTASWSSYLTTPSSFSYFNPSIEAVGASTNLDLFKLTSSSTPGLPGTIVGTFSVNNSGTLSFTSGATAVPEPGHTALLALGLGALVLRRRRA